jgi:hypothetical protein
MNEHRQPEAPATRALLIAAALAAAVGLATRAPAPATASLPSALQLADHALAQPTALEDESPYQLIDPVGPGGITQKQAVGEVTSSTMIGGLYNDNGRYGGGYGQTYFVPPAPTGRWNLPGGYQR